MVYEPAEDSYLLESQVKKHARGIVLDLGTGSGIQALAAAEKKEVKRVIASDIQQDVISKLKKRLKGRKITLIKSDLFEKIPNIKFDTIIFNPPYLPQQLKDKDVDTESGKKGYEIVERFLDEANDYLADDGAILLLFSSLTNKDVVDAIIKRNLLEYEQLSKSHIFFEDLFVYKITKSELLKKLSRKVKTLSFLAKGHRGIVFTARYKGKKVAIKAKLPESEAVGRIENEVNLLNLLNRHRIGPRLIYSEKEFFIMEFVEGKKIFDFVERSGKGRIKKVLKKVFEQCYEMDRLKVNKEEMHHPYKHVIVKGDNPVLIDFERASKTISPKNVTQLFQFIIGGRLRNLLEKKGLRVDKEKIIETSREYKKDLDKRHIAEVLSGL